MTKIKRFTPQHRVGKGNSPSAETTERKRVAQTLKASEKTENKNLKSGKKE